MSKQSKILEAVFHPAVFAIAFLACGIFAAINVFYNVFPYPWSMVLFIPLIVFGFLGHLIEEHQDQQ